MPKPKIYWREHYILRNKTFGGYLCGGWASYRLVSRDDAPQIPGATLIESAYDWRINWEAELVREEM